MPDSHAQAVKLAGRTTKELNMLFARLGTAEHPRGAILSAYRQARRALKGNVGNPQIIEEILFNLRMAIETASRDAYYNAVRIGNSQAERELSIYNLPIATISLEQETQSALSAILSIVDAQIDAARTIALTRDETLLLGDKARIGLLSPAPVMRDSVCYAALLAVEGHKRATTQALVQADAQDKFQRQAIAAIDERTTDCCLRVHGQTTTVEGDFTLVGVPRYADKLHAPPFHWYCRTAIALVPNRQKDDELTRAMQDAAKSELVARVEAQAQMNEIKKKLADLGQTPDIRIRKDDTQQIKSLRTKLRSWKARERVEIHPASALSGR